VFAEFLGKYYGSDEGEASMPENELIELLLPAYAPCRRFNEACAGACNWFPEKGLVPCGFGGATGGIGDVALVIVTAEPGDPPDGAGYTGGPEQMLLNSLRVFHDAMLHGGVERGGRLAPFHRNLRHILDCFWPNEPLEEQLRKTWTTNTVLCPAQVSGGPHFRQVEAICMADYLAPQLALFPDAFIFALGDKAKVRMQRAGLGFHATGYHPSARVSDMNKRDSWWAAAQQFRGGVRPVEPYPSPPVHVRKPSAHNVDKVNPQGAFSQKNRMADDLAAILAELPAESVEFLERIQSHSEFDCLKGRQQITVKFNGKKVGGLNPRAPHWYMSKVFVRDNGSAELMHRHGFQHVIHNANHEYWMFRGFEGVSAFEAAVIDMTGISF
jgi:hypothetical protein